MRHRVTRAGVRLDLTPKEFSLLSLFMRAKLDGPSEHKLLQTVRGLGYVIRSEDLTF